MRSGALLVMVLGFAGCKDRAVECVQVSPIPTPGMPLTYRAWCEATYEMEPAQNARCKGGTEADWRLRNPSSSAACDWIEAFDADLVFNPEAAADCLAELAAHPCGGGNCEGLLVPRREHGEGQACPRGGCLDGLECAYLDSPDQCPVCIPWPGRPLGSWCDLDGRCDEGECVDNHCREIIHEGWACGGQRETPCADGLFCLDRACRPRLKEDEPCTFVSYDSSGCADDLQCDPIDQVCRRPECLRGRVGDDCDPDERQCLDGLHCSLDDVCALPPIVGEPCGLIGIQDVRCTGSYCDARQSGQGHCQPRKEDGAPCTERDQCQSHFCDLGVCSPYPQMPPAPEMCSG